MCNGNLHGTYAENQFDTYFLYVVFFEKMFRWITQGWEVDNTKTKLLFILG